MPRYPASNSGLFFSQNTGNTSGVSLSNISALQGLTAVTVEAWIYLASQPSANNGKIFSFFSGNAGFQIYVAPSGGGFASLNAQVGNSTTSVTNTLGGVLINQQNHVVFTWDGANVACYLNGVKNTNVVLSGGNTGNPALTPFIGQVSTLGRTFPGTISELRISNTARYTATFTPPTQPFTSDANTVGLYHLWDGQGTVANDSSSQANNGTLSGSPLPVWSPGRFIGGPTSRTNASNRVQVQNFPASLSLNGTSSGVAGMVSPVRTAGQTLTWGGWCKPSYTPTQITMDIAGTRTGSAAGALFKVGISGASKWSVDYDTTGSGATGASTIPVAYGTWHSVIGMYDGTFIYLYVDGVQLFKSSSFTNAAISQTNFDIGRRSDSASEWWYGDIANVFITTEVFSVQDVAQFANGVIPTTHNYNGIWRLGEGAGTTAYDISGNANNGTITAGTFVLDVPSRRRQLVGSSLVYNGDFEFAPPAAANVATIANQSYIDGTSGGSATNSIFGWALQSVTGSGAGLFDNTQSVSGGYSLKLSTTATASAVVAGFPRRFGNGNDIPLSKTIFGILPSTSYTLTYYLKTVVNSGAATSGAFLTVVEQSASNGTTATNTSTKVNTTTGWTQYIMTFTTNSGTRQVDIRPQVVGNDGTATLVMDANFDLFVLTPTVNTTRSLAV